MDRSITDEEIREFLVEEKVKIIELKCVSNEDAWTKSFHITVECNNLDSVLQPDFWPDGIGCRRYWRNQSN